MLSQPMSNATPLVANAASDCPSSLRPPGSLLAFPARPRAGRLRPILVCALIALLAVTGARLLGEHGMTPPLPCGENLAAACAAP